MNTDSTDEPVKLNYAPPLAGNDDPYAISGFLTLPRTTILVCMGVFASTWAQTVTVGSVPVKTLLTEELKISPTKMAAFTAISQFAWYLKPILGLISDSFPLFRTRRRHYLMLGGLLSAIMWIVMALVPKEYGFILAAAVVLNVMLVLVSSVSGGLLVQEGKVLGATGRLSAARAVMMYVALFITGLIGGYLAKHHLMWTAIAGAVPSLVLVGVVWFLLNEPKATVADPNAFLTAWTRVVRALRSKELWAASALLFLVHFAPGFGTPLYFHMSKTLNLSPAVIGYTDAATGVGGVLASVLYLFVCRRFSLRWTYGISILLCALSALPFLMLTGPKSAIVINFIYGVGMVLADVASLDLAARATPKGSEALGYAFMISFWNIGMMVSDMLGSFMFDKNHLAVRFQTLIYLNAGTTALVLFAVPLLPAWLVKDKEGAHQQNANLPVS